MVFRSCCNEVVDHNTMQFINVLRPTSWNSSSCLEVRLSAYEIENLTIIPFVPCTSQTFLNGYLPLFWRCRRMAWNGSQAKGTNGG